MIKSTRLLLPLRLTACCSLVLCLALKASASPAPLIPGPVIEIPNATGKFDFLEVQSKPHRLLAGHEAGDSADFFDLDANQLITRVNLGGAPVHVAADPHTGNYFVSCQEGERVAIVSGTTLKETNSVKVAGPVDGILYLEKNRSVYVANDEGTHLWIINPDTEKLVGDITIPGIPEYFVYDAPSDRIYLNIKNKDEISVIDPNTNQVVGNISIAPVKAPHGLAIDSESGRLFSAGDNGLLAIVDIKSQKMIGTAKIHPKVDQATFDPYTKRIYCAASGEALSVVQETDSGAEFIADVKSGPGARNVAVDPVTHNVWTTYTDGKNSYAKSWSPVK